MRMQFKIEYVNYTFNSLTVLSVQTHCLKAVICLTICGSLERLTQPEISFRVSLFTVRMLLMRGCFVTISPIKKHKSNEQT